MNSFLWEIRYRPDVRINSITILLDNLNHYSHKRMHKVYFTAKKAAAIFYGCFLSRSAKQIAIF